LFFFVFFCCCFRTFFFSIKGGKQAFSASRFLHITLHSRSYAGVTLIYHTRRKNNIHATSLLLFLLLLFIFYLSSFFFPRLALCTARAWMGGERGGEGGVSNLLPRSVG